MKTNKTTRLAIALALAASPLLAGCGSSNNNGNNGNVGSVPSQVCNAYGCYTPGSAGGCIPINQPIPFSGTGLAITASNDIVGGQIPLGISQGSMSVGTQIPVGGMTFTSSGIVGQFSMSVASGASNSYAASNSGAVSGVLTISPTFQQMIQYQTMGSSIYSQTGSYYNYYQPIGYNSGSYSPYNYSNSSNVYGSMPCVSGIAIAGHLYTSNAAAGGFGATVTGYPGMGGVYLYLNGSTQHGYVLYPQ